MWFWRNCVSIAVGLFISTQAVPAFGQANNALDPLPANVYWFPVHDDGSDRPWAVLLPHASGISTGIEREDYVSSADRLRAMGIDVLLVHYRASSPIASTTWHDRPGPRIARTVVRAINAMRQRGRMSARCPGLAMGWSLGGEGALTLARDAPSDLGLRAAVSFYPTSAGLPRRNSINVPVLIVQGAEDRINPMTRLWRSFYQHLGQGRNLVSTLHLADAGYGFDLAHHPRRHRINGTRLVANPVAAEAAWRAIGNSLARNGIDFANCG